MIKFINFPLENPDKILIPLLQHIEITVITLLISFILATIISLAIMKNKILSQIILGFFSGVYSIPSLALFAILIPVPFLGLGMKTAIFVLVFYNQFILVRNILEGFKSVDKSIIEAATGMGMSSFQIFYKISLPLASPIILTGLKIAVISTIGIATIAASINAGGLGVLLFDGLRTDNNVKILWGTLMATLLTFTANIIMTYCERKMHHIARKS